MKSYLAAICIILVLLCSGCGTLKKKTAQLEHGMPTAKIVELWGQPTEKIKAGTTPKNYPVEVWGYYRKGIPPFGKDEDLILIFVDGELYSWAVNDPEFIFKELSELEVFKTDPSEFGLMQYQKSLRESTNQAIQTQKTMDVIRSYQLHRNTQINIQTMQQMRILQQQQLHKPPQPVQPPVRPIKRQ